jgi:hypothetical protein
MISRAHMRRQLRAKGGITDVVQRTNYLFGGIKKRIRKLIPNEIADVAVKAAPLVAMIPGQQGTAALMRGIGRFDQRGSISDALKQGALTYAGGKLFGAGMEKIGLRDPGASGIGEFFNEGTRSKAGSLFSRQTTDSAFKKPNIKDITDGSKSLLSGTKDLVKSGFKALPKGVAAQLAAGGITAGASLLASYFQGDFREQEPGETMEDYLAARKVAVGKQMRTYMDNYYASDPEYSALDDAGRDMFVARYNVKDGGRIEYQTGGISSANTLAENIRRNRANQVAFQQSIAPAQERARKKAFNVFMTPQGNVAKDQGIAQLARDTGKASSITNLPITSGTDISRMIGPGTGIKEPSYGGQQTYSNLGFAALPSSSQKTTTTPTTTVSKTNTAPDLTKQSEAYGRLMQQKFEEAYGNPEDYRAEAATLGMPLGVYMDYLMTFDPKDVSYSLRKENPYYDPQFDMPRVPEEKAQLDPLRMYFNRELQRQIDAGVPESERIKFGQVVAPPTMLPSSGIMPSMYESYADALARTRKDMGLAEGGMPMGIMRSNKAGVMERDYRDKGGFVPVGIKEKADDVPAMLSKNEFVMTANAVRGAGNGSIEKGAQRMYDTMKRLEKRAR